MFFFIVLAPDLRGNTGLCGATSVCSVASGYGACFILLLSATTAS